MPRTAIATTLGDRSAWASGPRWEPSVYILRDDADTQTLRIQLSGDVTTAEAARAASQAFSLAEAGSRSRVVCDLTGVNRGPDELEAVAALFPNRRLPFRIAFVGRANQLLVAVRLAEMGRFELSSGAFSNVADADAWLDHSPSEKPAVVSETVRRHALQRHEVAEQPRARRVKRAEPAA